MNTKDLTSLLPLTKTTSATDVPNEADLSSLTSSNGSKRIILRKPNLESILGGSTGKMSTGVTPELIKVRNQVFQRHQSCNPVSLEGSTGRVYVRSNSIDSTSAIKILSTAVNKKKSQGTALTVPLLPSSPPESKEQLIMRRTLSDSVEAIPRLDKENSKVSNRSGKTIITICQMEKERQSLQQQLSELVRNAESKRAEIASLKMEVNRLKESSSPSVDATVTSLKNEIDQLQQENRNLRERLDEFERSGPIGIQNAMSVGDSGGQKKGPHSLPDQMLGVEEGTSGLEKSRSCEWDKTSSTSISEVSVACLQDRISQMEETHYSTNEELQATLQELQDLQDQVNLLQLENEQLEAEKAVLYESLCSQTERLEETRNQVYKLKSLLFQESEEKVSDADTEKTHHDYLVDLLKSAQAEYDELVAKKEELVASANESRTKMMEIQTELESAVVNMKSLETKIVGLTDEKKQAEAALSETEKTVSALKIEVSVMKTQLEREQAKVTELLKDRDANATSELDVLLLEARQSKDKIEAEAVKLQEQLALSQLESSKLTDKIKRLEQEMASFKVDSETSLRSVQSKLKSETAEKEKLLKEVQTLEAMIHETEVKCLRHLEDKRELKASLNDLQKQLADEKSKASEVQKELQDIRSKFQQRQEEWKTFQDDLLTTVRVANDFKTEAQENMERILLRNKKMSERIPELEGEIARLKSCLPDTPTSPATDSSLMGPPVAVVPPVTPRRSMSVTPVCYTPPTRNSIRSVSLDPVSNSLVKTPLPRPSIAKWVDVRSASKMSVKTLIESLESSSKQAKACKSPSDSKSPPSSLAGCSSVDSSPSVFSTPEANLIKVNPDVKTGVQTPVGKSCLGEQTGSSSSSPLKSPLTLSAKKLDSLLRTNIGYTDCLVEKKDDPLADLVTGGGSKRNALLKWCQNKTAGYSNIDITNFSSSWNDGLAFCALIHTYLPDKIPFEQLDSRDKRRNFQLAFDAAESVGIKTDLDINEMITQERPGWHKVMAYVTSIYKHFET